MEARETGSPSLLDAILPPRLEDAGLEDCALPLDSIREAFAKAANFVGSCSAPDDAVDEEEGTECVPDPWLKDAEDVLHDAVVGGGGLEEEELVRDALVVGGGERKEPGECVVVKGGGVVEEGKDEVVVVGGGDDDVEEGRSGGGDEEKDRPILTEGFV